VGVVFADSLSFSFFAGEEAETTTGDRPIRLGEGGFFCCSFFLFFVVKSVQNKYFKFHLSFLMLIGGARSGVDCMNAGVSIFQI